MRHRVAGVVLVLVGLVAALAPWLPLWSFEPLAWWPPVAVGLALLWWRWGDRLPRWPLGAWLSRGFVVDVGVGLLAFGLCWVARDNSRSGDFQRVIFDIQHGVNFLEAEPLSPWMMGRLGEATKILGDPSVAGLQSLLCLWGALGFVALRRLALELCAERERLVPACFALLVATGSNALLFAHVETYTFSGVCMLWSMLFALRWLRGRGGPVLAIVFAALACAFHMQVLVLFPALLMVTAWSRTEPSARRAQLLAWLGTAAFLVAVQRLCAANPPPYPQHFGGGDGRMLVPTAQWFSPGHLLGVFNELFLLAPCALPVLAAFGVGWSPAHLRAAPSPAAEAQRSFAALACGGWLALAWAWNPDLGAWHDWDLFAGLGWVLTLWSAASLLRLEEVQARRWLGALALLSAARSVPFVWANHLGPVTGLH